MRRALGFIMIAGLLMGTAACGSSGDSDSKGSDTTEESSSGETTDSGNPDVKAYCDAVDDYIQDVEDAIDDPALAADLNTTSQELAEQAADLATANLSAEESQDVADCTKKSTDALVPN